MKKVILILVLTVVFGCKKKAPVPVLKTYSISGDITLINDCSGNGADNPNAIDITVKLWYNEDVNPSLLKIENVAMVLQADGVTSIGSYTVSDVPTNRTGKEWTIDFPKECSTILCNPGNCSNTSTNVRQPISAANTNTTYDYRYMCVCN